ncbi:hypothetical protein AB6N23_02050 [Cellulomonas sp. 179-A 9B4 NHS]|uniref:hypothetical protein n=1 Tax=Cellulomonas sp. 179-A 9B4 NHS TaxID=3142379 RepID=UPI0039A32E15
MGLWCTPTTAGGWVAMVLVWALALAAVLWALGRLFPVQRARPTPPPPAPAGDGDAGTAAAAPPASVGAPPAGS